MKKQKNKTLVLGASLKPQRYSHTAIERLQRNNIPTVAIGLREGQVAGVQIETEEVDWDDIHTVTLYLNAKRQKAYYDYILSLEPKRVIFNPGTENLEFYEKLMNKGVEVEVACTLVMLNLGQY